MNETFRNRILFAAILLIAVFLRFWAVDWGLPYTYQMEEYKVIKYALKMGTGDLNPHFFEYPSLYLYFMLFVYGLYFAFGKVLGVFTGVHAFAQAFVKDPTAFYVLGRSFEAAFGVGIVALTYFIGKRMFSEREGLAGSFLVAVLPEFINKACFTKGDMAAVFLGLVLWLLAWNIYSKGRVRDYVLAGVVSGLAVSTKYFMAPLAVVIPVAHWASGGRRPVGRLFVSLCLIPVSFFAGTPFALFSWKEFSLFLSDQSGTFSHFAGTRTGWFHRMFMVSWNYLRLTDRGYGFMFGSYGIGVMATAGVAALLRIRAKKFLLLIVPLAAYWLVVGRYHNPAAGYLQPVLPLFVLCAAYGFFFFWDLGAGKKLLRTVAAASFVIAGLSASGESFKIARSYTLKDTRTTSKEWIEANVPDGSRVLMDLLPNSPPLEMTRAQIEKFYRVALASGHYKAEYFKLKLETLSPGATAYEIHLVKRSADEIGSLPYQVREAQKVQDLVLTEGDGKDLSRLGRLGIRYVVVNRPAESDAERNIPKLAAFYREVAENAELIQSFEPVNQWQNAPAIRIYRIPKS